MVYVAIDTETHLIRPGVLAPKPVCASVCVEGSTPVLALPEAVHPIMCDKRATIIGQNFAYDAAVLSAWVDGALPVILDAYDEGRILDLIIIERTLDIADGALKGRVVDGKWRMNSYSLDALAGRYLGQKLDKGDDGWRLRYAELDGVPFDQWPERAAAYALDDADVTLKVFSAQVERAKKSGYWPLPPTVVNDCRAAFALHLMSCRGFAINKERVQEMRARFRDELTTVRAELYRMGFLKPKNAASKKAIQWGHWGDVELSKDTKKIKALVEEHLPDVERTPTGQPKTGAEVLEQIDHPASNLLVTLAKSEKVDSTYLRAMERDVFQPRYNALGAETGRTTCGKATVRMPGGETVQIGSNIQNLPRFPGVRECFVPRPGFVLIAADFNSQEMRTLAQSCVDILGYSSLAEAYQKNPDFDPHQQLADEHGVSRQHAKIANFGLPGGMGIRGLIRYARGYGVTLSEDEAEHLKTAWLNHWPEMRDYFAYVSGLPGVSDGIATLTHPRTGFTRGGVGYCDGCNFFFQHLASAASKLAIGDVSYGCYTQWLGKAFPLAFIHDEDILEAVESEAHEVAEWVVETMEAAQAKLTPDVPPRVEAHLMREWSKGAKDVRDENGRRAPWEVLNGNG